MRCLAAVAAAAALAVGASPAQAGVRVNQWDTFTLNERTCSGEQVRLTVRVHFVGIETVAPDDRYIVSGTHLNAVAAKGVTESGERYIFRDGSNSISTNFADPQGGSSFTATIRLRLIHLGGGAADDLVFRALHHVTVNANGDITSSRSSDTGFICS
jgi:hypothetical protein